jgi:carbamoyltransferase
VLQRLYERTGCPVNVNTSFNVRGQPIVCTPRDAYNCYQHTHIDVLVLGNRLLLKQKTTDIQESAGYLAQFQLD